MAHYPYQPSDDAIRYAISPHLYAAPEPAPVPADMAHGGDLPGVRVVAERDGTAAWEYPTGPRLWEEHRAYIVRVYTPAATYALPFPAETADDALAAALARETGPACADIVSGPYAVPATDDAVSAAFLAALRA